MKYIFEDKYEDLLSELFRSSYVDTSNFIYANRNSNIPNILNEYITDKNEQVFIFMDLIYDNKETAVIYQNNVSFIRKNGLKTVF